MTVGLPLAGPATTVQASRFLRPSQVSSASLRASWSVRVLSSDCRSALTRGAKSFAFGSRSRNEASKRVSVCLALWAKIAASRSVAFLAAR